MNKDFINRYDLIRPTSRDKVSENCMLTTIEYLILDWDMPLEAALESYINECKVGPGLYNQYPFPVEGKDKYMSPDQLIAIVSFLYLTGKHDEIKLIWTWLWKHGFSYNNITGKYDLRRTMQPKCLLFIGLCAGSNIAKCFTWVLWCSIWLACGAPPDDTSGKLKSWVIVKTLDLDWIVWMTKRVGGWRSVFVGYYQEELHPIRELLSRIVI